MAHTAKCEWSDDLGQLAHFYMYEIPLSCSTDNLAQMAQKVFLCFLKLSTHLLSTEGCFSNECHPYDVIGIPPGVVEVFPLSYLGIGPFIWLFLMILA